MVYYINGSGRFYNIIYMYYLNFFLCSRKGYDRKGMKSVVVKNYKNKIIFVKNKSFAISSTQLKTRAR